MATRREPGITEAGRGRPIRGNQGHPNIRPTFDISKSVLNASAREFVPRNPTQTNSSSAFQFQQSQPQMFQPSMSQRQNRPQQNFQSHYSQPMFEEQHQVPHPTFSTDMFRQGTALDRIREAIRYLTNEPGSFDQVMEPLTETLKKCIGNEKQLKEVVSEIVTQCIRTANFRYTGARLCNYFSHNLDVTFNEKSFRQHLLARCQEEHRKKDEQISHPVTRDELIGFTLFMAELLLNMTLGENDDHKMPILATAVEGLLLTLLSCGNDACLKCIVQVLKLSGATLEDIEKVEKNGVTELNAIFERIKIICADEKLNRSIKAMLSSVVELRNRDWGRKEKEASQQQNINNSQSQQVPAFNPYSQQQPNMIYNGSNVHPQQEFASAHMNFQTPPFCQQQQQQQQQLHHQQQQRFPPPGNNQFGQMPGQFSGLQGDFYPGSNDYWSTDIPEDELPEEYFMPEGGYEQFEDDDQFDDEIAAAYEEFLKEQNQ